MCLANVRWILISDDSVMWPRLSPVLKQKRWLTLKMRQVIWPPAIGTSMMLTLVFIFEKQCSACQNLPNFTKRGNKERIKCSREKTDFNRVEKSNQRNLRDKHTRYVFNGEHRLEE